MIDLFLSKPAPCAGDEHAVREKMLFLQQLEEVIRSLLSSSSYHEARLWLCTTISTIASVAPHSQRRLFTKLLNSGNSRREVAAQLLRMIFERTPQKAGSVIARTSGILEGFFDGNPRRILQWFDHFASTSEAGHKKGARALSQFAFVNRDVCWEELEWKGKHGQSPAVVATKPHYLHDLDVVATVENFLEHVPEFWSSGELADSVKDGEILQIDLGFFVDKFVFLMYEEDFSDIWAIVDEFLLEEQFSSLSQRVLILLDEHELRSFLVHLSEYVGRDSWHDFDYPSSWLEALLSLRNETIPLNDFVLLNALISQGRQLLRHLLDDEHEEERRKMDVLLQSNSGFSANDHYLLLNKCLEMELQDALKWIALRSWAVHFCIFKECKTKELCETLFSMNGIRFKRSGGCTLLLPDDFLRMSKLEDEYSDSCRKGRSRRKKKRRKNLVHDGDDFVDFEMSYGGDIHSTDVSWFLSTDDYTTSWNIVDLPGHLSRHCFGTWMKWICSGTL